MSDGTHIEWTDATLNVVNGCTVVSPGCTNCYAMRSGGRNLPNHPSTGLTKPSAAGHVWTGEVRFNEKALLEPLRWRRPRKIFWNAHGDLFHEAVPDEWIDRCFAVMALTPHHIHQVLTKRPERMREYLKNEALGIRVAEQMYALLDGKPFRFKWWPLPNVWLGVSVEDQKRADERIPILLDTPAAVRWLSCEPLLGPVDIRQWQHDYGCGCGWGGQPLDYCRECGWRGDAQGEIGEAVCPECKTPIEDYNACPECDGHDGDGDSFGPNSKPRIDWVVVGGESGPGARPMHPDWARSLRDQCAAADVPFLFKQWGEFAPGEVAGQYLDPEKAAKGMSLFDGRWDDCWSEPDGHCDDEPDVYRIGKTRAGRLLDGVQHDGYPQ